MQLTWVNHASFIAEHGDVRLLCDPWLDGAAFANGWDLLAKTRLDPAALANVTHIWYSHEHPDHFVPRVLKQIDEAARRRITVLYQDARDGKIASFCRDAGYQVRILREGETVSLGDVRVRCGQVPFYDSWLAIEGGGQRVLNLNDCVVDAPDVAASIAKQVGPIDVLLSQFNDAEWKGDPEHKQLREAAAAEMLRRLKLQAEILKPRFMIPFASYFYFSHVENFYLNDSKNRVGDVAAFVAPLATPVVLYPGDTWEVGAPHDNASAIARYEADRAAARPIHEAGPSVPVDELVKLAAAYRDRMKKQNSSLLLSTLLPSVTIRLDDLATTVAFDWKRGLAKSDATPDIAMHSESLAFVFRFDWGMDTLTVNGRFRASDAGYRRFIKTFAPGALNNIGKKLGLGLVTDRQFLKRMLGMRKARA